MAHTRSPSASSQPPKGTAQCRKVRSKRKRDDSSSSSDDEGTSKSNNKQAKPQKKSKTSRHEPSVDDDVVEVDDVPEDMDENEHILKKNVASWTSDVYDHYHSPPAIKVEENGTVKYVFTCKWHGTTHIRARKDTSTTNLKNHAERCDMKASSTKSKQTKIDEVASRYTYGEFHLLHAEWMTQSHRPTLIIEDPKLQEIYRLLNPNVKIPSDTTLGCDIKEVYEVSKERMKEMLKEHEGRFHITFDAWAAPNSHDYLGIVLVWCHEGQIRVVTLDLVELTEAHTGAYLAERVMEVLKEYGIEDRILGETGDNASVNDKTLDELEMLFKEVSELIITRRETQVRCFAHILNLIVKAILSQFEAKHRVKKPDDPAKKARSRQKDNNEDESDVDEFEDDDDDVLDDEDQAALEDIRKELDAEEDALIEEESWDRQEVLDLTDAEINTGVAPLTKLLKLSKCVFHKSTLQKDLADLCDKKNIAVLKMIRRVITRWNTTSNVIERGLHLRPALDALCIKSEHNKGKPPTKRLKCLRLHDVE
ncbi:uncharacterized protein ARMOST_22267 [Armillaria ostoyae]|uniref:HAT C-terminal dimerisation domain-containing protein n=1 Tax=Armillaria ostoyae TaxID=47428 RepID=A0A284SCF1_ARMOS|nr:uncharacterized protein ARMOST_22267 [Armillaria ostoyae]